MFKGKGLKGKCLYFLRAQVLRKALKISRPVSLVSGEVLRFHGRSLWHSVGEAAGTQSSFLISLVKLDEFNKIKLSKIGRLDQGLNPGRLHNS